ncbi:MAG: NADH-quinone oxidoreductase subunit NuoN [Sphingomonadaceae bacterium]
MTVALAASLAIGAPEVILAAGACALLVIGAFRGDAALPGLTLGAVILLALAAVPLVTQAPGDNAAWGGLYVADGLSRYLKLVILAGSAAALVIALPFFQRLRTGRFEYPVLILLSTIGMGLMVSAQNLLTLYVGLELTSLSSYVLAAFHRDEDRSSEAGLKYFALGAVASAILLYGISLIYGFTGSTGFAGIAAVLGAGPERNMGALFGLVFLLAALAFKVSAVPFHMWTPDVYQGAPTPVAAFLGTAPKVAAMGLLARLMLEAFAGMQADWQQIIVFLAIGSMVFGSLGAISQTNIKRLLAYSAISQIGFALIGLACATQAGIAALLLYLVVYLVMKLGAFICLLALTDADGRHVEELADLAGLVRSRPGVASALGILMLSLAGLPPLFGFMPKLAVFEAAVDANLWALAVIGVLSSVIAAFFYLRVVKIMFFDPPAEIALVRTPQGLNPVILAGTAAFSSPLGYLLLGPLSAAGLAAARTLF